MKPSSPNDRYIQTSTDQLLHDLLNRINVITMHCEMLESAGQSSERIKTIHGTALTMAKMIKKHQQPDE